MTTPNDRARLREVAAEYVEVVNSDEMNARRERWRRSNRLLERTVPFQIEDNGSFFHDLMPKPECEGEQERSFEARMLWALTNYRLIPDDRVFPRTFHVGWAVSRSSICPELEVRRVPDSTGRELGFETNTPLADLANSFHKLRSTEFSVDREATLRQAEAATNLFGDILPVEIVGGDVAGVGTGFAMNAVLLIGMDDFYIALLDQPENAHRFFEFQCADAERFLAWLEEGRLITPNGHEHDCGSGSCVYSDELPRRVIAPGDSVLASDCWGFIEAQEAAGLSPAAYAEFIYPYQKRIADRLGLINYGCCEAVHRFWPTLEGFRNLRKVTVSPWCDVPSISASVGRRAVLSRKPHPLQLCGASFDAVGFESHIRETLDITRDNFIELIFRDTCPLNGSMRERVAQACGIIKKVEGR